jgi:DNA replication protein DnaC
MELNEWQSLNGEVLNFVTESTVFPPEKYEYKAEKDGYCCRECGGLASVRLEDLGLSGGGFFAQLMGSRRHLRSMCECGVEREEARKRAEMSARHELHKRKTVAQDYADRSFARMTFARDNGANPKLTEICRRYADNFGEMHKAGGGLYLWGGPGTGKSFFASAIANTVLERVQPERYVPFESVAVMRLNALVDGFYKSQSGEFQQAIFEKLSVYSLVVLDDLGAEGTTEYRLSQVFNIVETRYSSRKPTIITSNYKLEDYAAKSLQHRRIADRVTEMCLPIEVKGATQRNNDRIRQLLV